ncbi:MAG: hypothetical protein ABIJ09_25175 [Pseudomonadota bacterium]
MNRNILAVFLGMVLCVLIACEPTPCEQLARTWMECWCAGATPSTTRPQSSIDEACASEQAFLASPVAVPEAERTALTRCDDDDAIWAQQRLDQSECRGGGSFVCGGTASDSACMPPD